MPQVSLDLDRRTLEQARGMLSGVANGLNIAVYTAINKTLISERADLTRRVNRLSVLKLKDIRDNIKVTKRATKNNPTGQLTADYESEPLWHFPHNTGRKGRGVAAQFTFGGGGKFFPYMFKGAAPKGKKKLIFYRELGKAKIAPKVGKYAGRVHKRGPLKGRPILRQPLETGLGPPVVGTMERNPQVIEETLADTQAKFEKTLMSQIDWLLQNPDIAQKQTATRGDNRTAQKLRHIWRDEEPLE